MVYKLITLLFCLLPASVALAQSTDINIIPKPVSVKARAGAFKLLKSTKIMIWDEQAREIADAVNSGLMRQYGFRLKIVDQGASSKNVIVLVRARIQDGADYMLSVETDKILLMGNQEGLFHGVQSFLQLLPDKKVSEIKIQAVSIEDRPRFPYRGMHLDVARHFMPVKFVKKYIDLMSQYKFNYFHWHLTEDQGWRIEIKKYPKLTEIGSKRPESHEGSYSTTFKGDGRPVEGFYTQEQIRDVVAYAKARYITVIPEIELPGHASAALAAYPQFGCKTDYQYEVKKTWGIFKEVFCPTDETFKFLEDVLDETIKLFPDSPYIHIGGDEVLKDQWKESAFVQELKKKEDLKDEHEVQSYFVRRIEKFINLKGKKMIGWDEILEGGLAPNATVMSWRGMRGGIAAAKAKHDVIMTPTDFAYFDYGQGDPAFEPLNIGGYLPLEKVYSFEPVPKELTADEAKYVIGGQANIWTEYLETPAAVEYMAFPRMLALAESVWSRPEDKNFADFNRRLASHFPRLDKQNVNYRIPEPAGLKNVIVGGDGDAIIELAPVADTTIYYTFDGSDPHKASQVYTQPVAVKLKPGERVELKIAVANAVGRKSSVYAATLIRREMFPAIDAGERKPGARFEIWTTPASPIVAGVTRTIMLPQFLNQSIEGLGRLNIDPKMPFDVIFDGLIKVPTDGIYEFQIDSTWGASLDIGGGKIIDEKGSKDRTVKSAVIPLKAGYHELGLRYSHGGGESHFRVRFGIKGQGLRQIGAGELVY